MIISSSNSERELLGILNKLDKNKQLSTQCYVNVYVYIYATLFVECRLCNYVGPNYATFIY